MTKRKVLPTRYAGITRNVVLDPNTQKWIEPKYGSKFNARRYIRGLDGKEVRVKRSFETIAEAKAFMDGATVEKVEKEIQKTHLLENRDGCMTFGILLEYWKRDWLPNKDVSTQVRYKGYLKHFEFLLNFVVDEIGPSHIDQWITYVKRPEYLAQSHATRCSYERELKIIRTVLNFYASRFNRNYKLPFISDHREMIWVRNKPTIRKDLTVDQFSAFIKELRELVLGTDREVIYYLALMQYGIYGRIQDAAALSYESFDFKRNMLTINQKVQWVRQKGTLPKVVPGSKTDGGKILSPIPELASQVFREWIMRSGVRTGLLFQLDGKVITYRQIDYLYSKALQKANLPFRATHILRHAALTEAYDSCRDLLLVQRLAGQRDLRSTTRYAKVRDHQIAEVQKQIDQKLLSIMA